MRVRCPLLKPNTKKKPQKKNIFEWIFFNHFLLLGNTNGHYQELFTTVGAIKKVRVYYDKSGRSEGKAEITFESKQDAESAVKQFNGAKCEFWLRFLGNLCYFRIDGKPMSIEILPDAPVRERRNKYGGDRSRRGRNNRQNQRGNWNNNSRNNGGSNNGGGNNGGIDDIKIKVSF